MPVGSVQVNLRGPFFKANVPAIIVGALDDAIGDIVAFGEVDVKLQLYPGHGQITGRYKGAVKGEMVKSLQGIIHDTDIRTGQPVVYGPWLEGVSSRNQTSRFKGYAMFRNTRQRIQTKAGTFLRESVQRALQGLR